MEFLKWTRGLRTDDDILLVAALEALHLHYYVPEGTHPGSSEPRSILVQPPFWLDTVHGQNHNNDVSDWHWQDSVLRPMLQDKHPFNVIEGYADLKKLDGHVYNVIEFAYLEGGWRKFKSPWDLVSGWTYTNHLVWTAIIAFVSQVLFSFILFFWYLVNQTPVIYVREPYAFTLVIIVALISTIVFSNIVWKQIKDCWDFNAIDSGEYWTTLKASNFAYLFGKFLLWINFVVNILLAPPLCVFNLYVVLTSDTPVSAILNAVTLAFVLEVDDLLAPSWDDDRTEDAKAKLFHECISEPFPGTADPNLLNMRFTRINPHGGIPYQDGDKLYIKVPDEISDLHEFDITVFRGNDALESKVTPTERYETITYRISGPPQYLSSFHEKIKQFYCMQNYENFKQHVERMNMMDEMKKQD